MHQELVEVLQSQLEAALTEKDSMEHQLRVSQRQTDSAVNQLRDMQIRLDGMQVGTPSS